MLGSGRSRDSQSGEPGHVRPSVLRPHLSAGGRQIDLRIAADQSMLSQDPDVSATGDIVIYNYTGNVEVIVDVVGWFAGGDL